MQITSREDALIALPTPKSKLRAFEKRIYELDECTPFDLYRFLVYENVEIMIPPEWGSIIMGIQYILTKEINLNTMKYWGDPLGCNFQFRKVAKRKSRKNNPLPLRFHGRVYLDDQVIVVVTEIETDPKDIPSGITHLIESHEHRIIRFRRKVI